MNEAGDGSISFPLAMMVVTDKLDYQTAKDINHYFMEGRHPKSFGDVCMLASQALRYSEEQELLRQNRRNDRRSNLLVGEVIGLS